MKHGCCPLCIAEIHHMHSSAEACIRSLAIPLPTPLWVSLAILLAFILGMTTMGVMTCLNGWAAFPGGCW